MTNSYTNPLKVVPQSFLGIPPRSRSLPFGSLFGVLLRRFRGAPEHARLEIDHGRSSSEEAFCLTRARKQTLVYILYFISRTYCRVLESVLILVVTLVEELASVLPAVVSVLHLLSTC